MIGSCTDDSKCTDTTTCDPCSNLYNSKYSLLVTDDKPAYTNATKNINQYLGICPDLVNTLKPTLEPSSSSTSDSPSSMISTAAIIGVVIAVIIACGFIIFCYRRYKISISLEKVYIICL